ncbi:quinone-dependent dihydroorotate dehydrogenase [Mesorhizobium sp. RP14(2022)]|uniref:Dihydroorotate dehydrogenase (quinone) n=1 Tax=Mesorhizobium liriopis TaxID=2953882 RepID=A0ABT1C0H9_9HYPH|nr:quinone-dependent dihydroorotate dehydrogenase [Mesorhizobium liriopis]
MGVTDLASRALLKLDPERAHRLAIRGLALKPAGRRAVADPLLGTQLCGLDFPNPLGLAAGFDKNGEAADGLFGLGFGFVEVGTVTPLPQPGNPRPRIFRIEEAHGVINRLGFNNEGHEALLKRLEKRKSRGGLLGINIGANKDSADRVADYVLGVERFAGLASYLTVNISSPNTPGLRDLQARDSLRELLGRVVEARNATVAHVPVFLKIAPDLDGMALADVAVEAEAARIEGVIVSNTTLSRPLPEGAPHAKETGGLSGRPLFDRSTVVLARMRKLVGPQMVLIGAGGVDSARSAAEKIRAGADLVQIYTGLIYGGAGLPAQIVANLRKLVRQEGVAHLRELRDTRLDYWASQPL